MSAVFFRRLYLCVGSRQLNLTISIVTLLHGHKIFVEKFTDHNFIFLNKNCVYPLTSKRIEMFYQTVDLEIKKTLNNNSIIGFHWFAGHPLSQEFENQLTLDNVNNYNNLLSTIIKGSYNET